MIARKGIEPLACRGQHCFLVVKMKWNLLQILLEFNWLRNTVLHVSEITLKIDEKCCKWSLRFLGILECISIICLGPQLLYVFTCQQVLPGELPVLPLPSLSLALSPCLSLLLTVAALLSALNEFYSCVGVEAHDKCDERIKRKTPHSFSCPPSSATHTPQLSLSLSLHLAFFRCTWAHVVCCSKLSIRHGVRHCRSCLAISQLPPCLTISTSTSACLPPSLTASSLSRSPHRSSRINYCN